MTAIESIPRERNTITVQVPTKVDLVTIQIPWQQVKEILVQHFGCREVGPERTMLPCNPSLVEMSYIHTPDSDRQPYALALSWHESPLSAGKSEHVAIPKPEDKSDR